MSDDKDWEQITYLLNTDPAMIGSCGDPWYLLSDLEKSFDECTELAKNFWALKRQDGHQCMVSFVEFCQSNTDGSDLVVGHVFSSGGPTAPLRECRHSYFGPDAKGYVFYLNFDHTMLAIKYLEQFFDGD